LTIQNAPPVVVVVGSLLIHGVGEGIRRYRVRPTVQYAEGRWWLRIEPRGIGEVVGIKCKVVDEDGAAATHDYAQLAPDGVVTDWFPDGWDVGRMKAGSRQPWGQYEARWEVIPRPGRRMRATVAFEWRDIMFRGRQS
jgi:hypothetical protein